MIKCQTCFGSLLWTNTKKFETKMMSSRVFQRIFSFSCFFLFPFFFGNWRKFFRHDYNNDKEVWICAIIQRRTIKRMKRTTKYSIEIVLYFAISEAVVLNSILILHENKLIIVSFFCRPTTIHKSILASLTTKTVIRLKMMKRNFHRIDIRKFENERNNSKKSVINSK